MKQRNPRSYGSPRHIKNVKLVANILRKNGFTVVGDEHDERTFSVPCGRRDGDYQDYYVDLYAERKDRRLIVEIHDKRGHGSRITIGADKNRWEDISSSDRDRHRELPRLEYFELWYWQLNAKDVTEEDIKKELRIEQKT